MCILFYSRGKTGEGAIANLVLAPVPLKTERTGARERRKVVRYRERGLNGREVDE